MNYENIVKANELIKPIELKGKQYAEVKERIKAFRFLYPNGCIKTEMVKYDKDEIIFKASAYEKSLVEDEYTDDLFLLSTGFARGKSNKFFSLEDCETSAVGRCLSFLALGIDTSIASAEEIKDVEEKEIFDEPTLTDLTNEFRQLYNVKQQAEILNHAGVVNAEDLGAETLSKYINYKKYGKK